ncbi:MAG TPA: ArsR family transcriptional regulator, partial [Acidimicrobiales bacterium]|nr:ArsR family transcriptional regulator [Acidimicrobiales bacterium]
MSAGTADPDACPAPAVDPDRVAATRRRLPEPRELARLAELFRLLGDPGRARILSALLEAGELCVCDIAATVGTPETS